MTDAGPFALVVLLTAAVILVGVVSSRLTEWVKVPSPVLVLVGSAVAVQFMPWLGPSSELTVERVVTVALLFILFDGGMHIGRARFRKAAGPIAILGVLGTALTVAAAAALVHYAFGFGWYVAVLVGTAVSPTDPAVVFSVLGKREVSGRSGTILEGESGANDPVGIALMGSLVAAGALSARAWGQVGDDFLLEMVVGAAVGIIGGRLLLLFMRKVPLASEGLYPLRTLAGALVLFGVATVAHGSGFLAVFVAGIVIGDERAPYKREIERFHGALASLGEIVAFLVLGLTVDLAVIFHPDVWIPGLILGLVLAFVIRPIVVGLCLLPSGLPRNELAFVLFAGLKGAVPILLGSFLLAARVPDAERLYGIVVVVVVFSVVVQGSLAPRVARWLRVPMRVIEPQPWALAVQLRNEPEAVHRMTVVGGSPADGQRIDVLAEVSEDAWVSMVVRDGRLLNVRSSTTLKAGDDVVVLAGPEVRGELARAFGLKEVEAARPPRAVAWGRRLKSRRSSGGT